MAKYCQLKSSYPSILFVNSSGPQIAYNLSNPFKSDSSVWIDGSRLGIGDLEAPCIRLVSFDRNSFNVSTEIRPLRPFHSVGGWLRI